MSGWAAEVHRSFLVKFWRFLLDQFHPCFRICVAFCLEVVVALGGEEAEQVLPAAFWVFEVADSVEVVEADFFEEPLLGGRFVEGEKVGTENKVEGFPLLGGAPWPLRRQPSSPPWHSAGLERIHAMAVRWCTVEILQRKPIIPI